MATVGFVVDPSTFERKKIGPVWGTIFFQFEQGRFPAAGWSDIVVPIITEWLAVLSRVATGTSGTHEARFMDGPFLMTVRRIDEASVSLELVDDHPARATTELSANLNMLLENAITIGEQIQKECRVRKWRDRDTESLARELRRAASARRPLQ
jgi:hypothetical protein